MEATKVSESLLQQEDEQSDVIVLVVFWESWFFYSSLMMKSLNVVLFFLWWFLNDLEREVEDEEWQVPRGFLNVKIGGRPVIGAPHRQAKVRLAGVPWVFTIENLREAYSRLLYLTAALCRWLRKVSTSSQHQVVMMHDLG
jgi:hypothetical protein